MELSARNALKAKIKSIKLGEVAAEAVLDVGGQEMCSTITVSSVKRLGLKEGDDVFAVIKASSVMIGK
ncbi:MAG: TOBE domain-containing protein [Peptococcaceae bacterium]|nr:TOBE domain-containing protein [Peptococcaceae bacterium]